MRRKRYIKKNPLRKERRGRPKLDPSKMLPVSSLLEKEWITPREAKEILKASAYTTNKNTKSNNIYQWIERFPGIYKKILGKKIINTEKFVLLLCDQLEKKKGIDNV